jgi:GAF domain-containing protein
MNDTAAGSTHEQPRDPMHAFAELALITVNNGPPDQTMHRVAELAKRTLGGIDDASVTVIKDGRPRSVTFIGRLAVDLDERQYEIGFGPCLDAAMTGQTIMVDNDSEDTTYREFARVAARAGVHHVLSVGMPLAQRSVGGLNLYSKSERGFPPELIEHAEVFAGYAAVAVNNVTSYAEATGEASNLRRAMESRATIEQAKGIVMAHNHCSPDEAFDMIRRVSQHRNIKLRELAQDIVNSAQK